MAVRSRWLAWGSPELRMDWKGSFLRDALTSTANRLSWNPDSVWLGAQAGRFRSWVKSHQNGLLGTLMWHGEREQARRGFGFPIGSRLMVGHFPLKIMV